MDFEELNPIELARSAFNEYRRSSHGRTDDDRAIPPWENLGPAARGHWLRAAQKVKKIVENHESIRWVNLRVISDAKNRSAMGTLNRIKLLHTQGKLPMGMTSGYCIECESIWPCETIRLIDETAEAAPEVSTDAVRLGASQG